MNAPASLSFDDYLQHCRERIQQAMPALLPATQSEFSAADTERALARLREASHYSLMNGGKRVRACLVYASAQALGSDDKLAGDLDKIAAALEMIHAYSLVHDDLPAMDDDDLRRGQPTCHIAYDEATAILVGDALQCRAFEILTKLSHCSPQQQLDMVRLLSAASGARGMVGGQAIDLAAVNRQLELTELQTMHQLKTGALIRAAIGLGAIASGASATQREQLDRFGTAIGLSFQVQDDIIDIESSTETLGKTQGADQALNKPTFPQLLGLEGAKALANQLHEQALAALSDFGDPAWALRELSYYIIARKH
jgi:geranylgeranyl pyrophosphate synthase